MMFDTHMKIEIVYRNLHAAIGKQLSFARMYNGYHLLKIQPGSGYPHERDCKRSPLDIGESTSI
jgi:hypothetical protein